jgi:hypothetical protein
MAWHTIVLNLYLKAENFENGLPAYPRLHHLNEALKDIIF